MAAPASPAAHAAQHVVVASQLLRLALPVPCRDVWDTYLAAWPACIEEAASVMCSYNSIGGTPVCASSWLQEQLRDGMGFRWVPA